MRLIGAVLALLAAAACSTAQQPIYPSLVTGESLPPPPGLDATLIAQGADLYAVHCAGCHRADLTGDPEWRSPAADGGFRPPPHDSSGHTWHHSDQALVDIVLYGYDPPVAESRMPQFFGVLTEEQVLAILEFFKSSWGGEERQYQWEQTLRHVDG